MAGSLIPGIDLGMVGGSGGISMPTSSSAKGGTVTYTNNFGGTKSNSMLLLGIGAGIALLLAVGWFKGAK